MPSLFADAAVNWPTALVTIVPQLVTLGMAMLAWLKSRDNAAALATAHVELKKNTEATETAAALAATASVKANSAAAVGQQTAATAGEILEKVNGERDQMRDKIRQLLAENAALKAQRFNP